MNKQTDDYLAHWGIKGMHWDKGVQTPEELALQQYKAEEDALMGANDLSKLYDYAPDGTPMGSRGYVDGMGNKYPGMIKDAVKAKQAYDRSLSDFSAKSKAGTLSLYKATTKISSSRTMISKVRDISSSAIAKGKAFLNSLFNR